MGVTIAPDRWDAFAGLADLAMVLGADAGQARYVGGAVRDTLLGIPVADVDIATSHAPEAVIAKLRDAGIKAVPTGLAHGTVTAVLASGQPVEVTTLRRDVSTDGRHALVAFTDDWREDAARRDFTMNALYADPATGAISDFFGGLADLAARRVRFIGDPLQRIAEDHLRILRFFRFHARFGDAIDADGLNACVARSRDLMALSRERIAGEMLKLLVTSNAVEVVGLMVERGILLSVLPEIDGEGCARLASLALREAAAGIAPDAIRRLAALLPPEASEGVGARLKLSNADRKRLIGATAGTGDEGPRGLAYRVGAAQAVDRLLITGQDPSTVVGWSPPRLPVSGGALVARGLEKGPVVAQALREVERHWVAEGFPDAARVDQLADVVAASFLNSSSASASSTSSGRP
ncbi:poly(A) polymerase [Sphingomonas gellani]|uniref:Poly(A) polymerase n=1 Tax=Sphingomonas gellani TaxID=1166340 RepID=A0A1H8F0T4_9SPHN|nr:CCA tRNA nucleotidyltransferase [Sphingomonas gellani]SEN24608.1 poly(A) polymerase [Sphingomonas gellani]